MKKGVNKEVAERLILAKLFKDGIITLDENEVYHFDMRRSVLKERYQEESVEDLLTILKDTATGLEGMGHTVKRVWLEGKTNDIAEALMRPSEEG